MTTIELAIGQVWQGKQTGIKRTIRGLDNSTVHFTIEGHYEVMRYNRAEWIKDHALVSPVPSMNAHEINVRMKQQENQAAIDRFVASVNDVDPLNVLKPEVAATIMGVKQKGHYGPTPAKRDRIDVMLDIESLSTAHNGATIQISAKPFCIYGQGVIDSDNFNASVSPKSCIEAGLHVCSDTMKWWFSQDPEVQNKVLGGAIRQGLSLEVSLEYFTRFLEALQEKAERVFIWGYPATSDLTWLQQAYLAAKLPYPIAYNRTRCLSTIADLYWEKTGEKLSDKATTKINHDALQDCQSQIEMIIVAYKEFA